MIVLPEGTLFGAGGLPESNVTESSAGTTITAPATANQKNTTWTTLIASTVGASYGVMVRLQGISSATTVTAILIDIGLGAASSEIVLLPDLNGGACPDHAAGLAGGKDFFFPVYIPAGSRVSARAAAGVASDSCIVSIFLFKKSLYPVLCGQVSAYGVDLAGGSRGTLVTPGNGAFGSWTLLKAGPLDRPHTLWFAQMDQGTDTTQGDDRYYFLQLGIGPDSSNVTPIFQGHCGEEGGLEEIDGMFPALPQYAPTIADAAADLWARFAMTGAAEARGVIAYGMD